jgi:Predicted phosphatases
MLNDGRLSKAQAFRQIMASCGAQATDDLIAEMVRRDQELLLANARLYDDVIPFLTRLSDRGIKIAIVSNCTENTRAMLVATGVDQLADELVLSCEVRSAKPAAGDIPARSRPARGEPGGRRVRGRPGALLCGQRGRGIRAAQIVRGELDGQLPAEGVTLVRSLAGGRGAVRRVAGARPRLGAWTPA